MVIIALYHTVNLWTQKKKILRKNVKKKLNSPQQVLMFLLLSVQSASADLQMKKNA